MLMSRCVTFESLLLTGRAVIRRANWVRIHLAGEDPVCYWLEFENKRTAKLAARSVQLHIREQIAVGKCNTDTMYNGFLLDWFEQLRRGGYIRNTRQMEANSEHKTSYP